MCVCVHIYIYRERYMHIHILERNTQCETLSTLRTPDDGCQRPRHDGSASPPWSRGVNAFTRSQKVLRLCDTVGVYNMHKKYLNNILPNLTFFLDTKINLISKRLTKRKLKNKYDIIDDKFNSTIRKGYLKIAKNKKRFIIINSSLPINEIQYKIIKIISNKIKNYGIRISQKNKL